MKDNEAKAALTKNDMVAQLAANQGMHAMASEIEAGLGGDASEAERITCMNAAAIMIVSALGDQLAECLLKSEGDPTNPTWRAIAGMFVVRHYTDIGGVLATLANKGIGIEGVVENKEDNEDG